MQQNKLLQSQELNNQGIEHLEQALDFNSTKVIVLHSITSKNYLSEIDIASVVSNIFNEFTGFTIFELDGSISSDIQVIHHDSFNNKTNVSFKQLLSQLQRGLYIGFTTRKQDSYEGQLMKAMKIIQFIQSIIRQGDADTLYEKTSQWIQQHK